MSILLDEDGNNIGSPDIELVAFNGNEVRAVCSPTWDRSSKRYIYYMLVYANAGEDVSVDVKAYYKATGKPVILGGKEVVTPPTSVEVNESIGTPSLPSQIQNEVDVRLQAISVDETVQTYTVGGAKSFALKTNPEGVTGISVAYQQNGSPVATPTAAGSYDVVLFRKGDATYQPYERTLKNALVIGKTAPTVTWPAGLTVQEGEALSTLSLTQPGNGIFSWINSGFVCQSAGDYYQEMLFTPSSADEYPVRNFVKVTASSIARTDIAITATATQTFTYDGTAKAFAYTATPNASGFKVTYKLNNAAVSPIAVGTYTVAIERQQDATYNAVNKIFTDGLVIRQADPTGIVWPGGAQVYSGQKLSEATWTGTNPSGDGTFVWVNKDNTLNATSGASTVSMKLRFIPTDNANYKTVEKDITVTIKVRMDIAITETVQTQTYNEQVQSFQVIPTPATLTDFTIAYAQKGVAVVGPKNAGTYDVTVTRPGDNDYNPFSKTIAGGLVINTAAYPADKVALIPWPVNLEDSVTRKLSAIQLTQPTNGAFSWKTPDQQLIQGEQTATLIFTPADKSYKAEEKAITVKGLLGIAIVTAVQEFPYDAKPKAFVVKSTPAGITGITLTYSSGGVAVAAPVNAGTYDVKIVRPRQSADNYLALDKTISGGLVIKPVVYPDSLANKVVWPESGVSCYTGQRLSAVTPAAVTAGKFAWVNPDLTFTNPGNYEAELLFTPADKNFTAVKKKVTVKVTTAPVPPQPVTYRVEFKASAGGTLIVHDGNKPVSSGSSVEENTVLNLTATPKTGYRFQHFLVDGAVYTDTEITVTRNMVIEAIFSTAVANEGISQDDGIRFYTKQGVLHIETDYPVETQVVSMLGIVVYNAKITGVRTIYNLPKGVYLLVIKDEKGQQKVKRIML